MASKSPNRTATSSGLQEICALIGQPVAGNPTQYILEKLFASKGLDWRCLSLEVAPEAIADAVRGIKALGFRGANIARPYRERVPAHVDRLGEIAEATVAVTCLTSETDGLVGDNFEGDALIAALRQVIDPAGKQVQLAGSGSSARAIGLALVHAGISRLVVSEPTVDSPHSLTKFLEGKSATVVEFAPLERELLALSDADALIFAAEASGDAASTFDLKQAKNELIVVDTTPPPVETPLVRQARQADLQTIDSLTLFIHEVGFSFQRWSGIEPNFVLLREAAEEFLAI